MNFNKTLLSLLMLLAGSVAAAQGLYTNPILPSGADPWIVKHDGLYYYCATKGTGIGVSVSDKLHVIKPLKQVWKPQPEQWHSRCVWAPELHHWNDKWYIVYAAGEAGPPYIHQRTGVLESVTNDAQGEYVDKGMVYTGDNLGDWDANRWSIDMTYLEHDGRLYAIWSGWKNIETTDATPQNLYIALMDNPWTAATSRVLISEPDAPYEIIDDKLPINEGPQVLRSGEDVYVVYSCGQSWLDTYKLTYIKLRRGADPLLRESWDKSAEPVFVGNRHALGVGHASFTTSPDDTEHYIVYHAKKSSEPGWSRDVRLQKFIFDVSGAPVFGEPANTALPLPLPSGTKPE